MNLSINNQENKNIENLYQILGLSKTSNLEEIRLAYEKKLQEFHEESLANYSLNSEDENEKKLMSLSLAYMRLYDPGLRESFDEKN